MSKNEAYRARVTAISYSRQDDLINSTKRQAHASMMGSPTLSYITLNDEDSTRPSIVSDMETFNKRRFLFLPDSVTNVGDYVKHKDMTYLATDAVKDEIFPQIVGELCNNQFSVRTAIIKVLIGRDPNTGRPFYDEEEVDVFVPCVAEYQSFLSDDGRFLIPKGRLKVAVKYDATFDISLNREFSMYDIKYKITDVDLTKVIDDIGFATIVCEAVV